MLNLEQIEQLELKRKHQLSKTESAALTQVLTDDAALSEEANQLNVLWDGFEMLRDEHFKTQVSNWNEEWNNTDDGELAEWYIQKQLSTENEKWINQRMTEDADFKSLIENQTTLLGGLQAAGDEHFRQRLLQWNENKVDGKSTAKMKSLQPQFIRRLAVAATILLLFFVGGKWHASQNYSNLSIALEAHKSPNSGGVLGGRNVTVSEFKTSFDAAHKLFKDGQIPEAKQGFLNLQSMILDAKLDEDDVIYYTDNIEWNLLLTQLATNDTSDNFANQLAAIANNGNHEFQAEAQELQQKLASFWRIF